jgi:hypothetical protein
MVSCTKNPSSIKFEYLDTKTNHDIYDAVIDEKDNIHMIGGDVWTAGTHLTVNNGILDLKTFSTKAAFDMLMLPDNQFLTVGTDGFLYRYEINAKKWNFYRLPYWDILTGIVPTKNRKVLAYGGKAYETGYIYIIDENYQLDTTIYFDHEINDIEGLADGSHIHCGWGHVMISDKNAKIWTRSKIQGDHFVDMAIQENVIFLVGLNGSLWTSKDRGQTWTKQTNIKAGFDSFRSITHLNDKLIITGSKGRFWISTDQGLTWKSYQTDDKDEWLGSIYYVNGQLLLYGTLGKAAVIEMD